MRSPLRVTAWPSRSFASGASPAVRSSTSASPNAFCTSALPTLSVLGVVSGAFGSNGTVNRSTLPSRAANRWNSSEPRVSSVYVWSQFAIAEHAGPTGTGPDDDGACPPGRTRTASPGPPP